MKIMDRIIGIWMMIAGAGLFAFAHTLEPYMDTLSGATLYVVAISTAILIAVPTGCLFGYGTAQAIGVINIQVGGGK